MFNYVHHSWVFSVCCHCCLVMLLLGTCMLLFVVVCWVHCMFLVQGYIAVRSSWVCCMLLLVQGYIAVHSSWVCCSSYKAILLFILLGYVAHRTRLYCCSFFLGMLVVVVGYVVIGYIAVCCRRCWVCCSSYLCILLFVVVIVLFVFLVSCLTNHQVIWMWNNV